MAIIMMENCLVTLESVLAGVWKEGKLQDVLSIGWEYLTAADEQNLFTVPVLDADVPGYSQRVPKVMALSMMNAKLYHRQYGSLLSFTEDVHLMLINYKKYSPSPAGAQVCLLCYYYRMYQ